MHYCDFNQHALIDRFLKVKALGHRKPVQTKNCNFKPQKWSTNNVKCMFYGTFIQSEKKGPPTINEGLSSAKDNTCHVPSSHI